MNLVNFVQVFQALERLSANQRDRVFIQAIVQDLAYFSHTTTSTVLHNDL
jgi:hypothetical protein